MNLLPPWSLAERTEWAEAQPWLAGFYFGLIFSLAWAVYTVIVGGGRGIFLAPLAGLLMWPLIAVGVQRGWD